MKIPFNDLRRSLLAVSDEARDAIARVIRSGVFLSGRETEAFVAELAEYLNSKHIIPVGNGTDALEIALLALGVGQDDTVVTVANAGGYATTAILKCGAQPLYVDVSPSTLQMEVGNLEKTVLSSSQKPKALVLTHLYGYLAPAAEVVKYCQKHSIAVVEDCAQAIGVEDNGTHVGRFGDIGTLSFYPTKNLGGIGDSGAIFTDNHELFERAEQLSQYGWRVKYRSEIKFGKNSRMDEVQAAILRLKLQRLDEKNRRRKKIIGYLGENLETLFFPHLGGHPFNGHITIVLQEHRDRLQHFLATRGVETAIHYPVPDYKQNAWFNSEVELESTELTVKQALSLPVFPELTDLEVDYLLEVLREWR